MSSFQESFASDNKISILGEGRVLSYSSINF